MSERIDMGTDGEVGQPVNAGSVTAGALLKKSREESGLHIGALAVSLKVPVSKLEALEAGNLAQLSGPVFVRALASSVCRTLKIDPAPILLHLPVAETAHLHQKGDLNEPFRGEGRGVHFLATERLLKPSVIVVIFLLLGAVLLMFLPNLRSLWSSADHVTVASSSQSQPVNDAVSSVPAPAEVASAAAPAPFVQEPVQTPALTPAPVVPTVPAVPVSSVNPSTGEPRLQSARSDVEAVGGSPALVFKANGSSWVEVTDGKGTVVFRKTLSAGEIAPVGGMPPLKVIVGRADLTEVTARGARVDLLAVAKDNVARFEVKP